MFHNRQTTGTSRRSVIGLLGAIPVAAGGVVAGAGSAQAAGQQSGRVPADLRPGGEFDRFVAELAKKDEFSGTVLLAHHGRPVLTRSYGMANRAKSIPIRHDTIFNIASVGKMFTGVAIAQLAARGKVAFHAPLSSYLDGFTAAMSKVTLHQLLTHSAGFGDYQTHGDWAEVSAGWRTPEESFEGTMDLIRSQPEPLFVPGSDNKYSNSGLYTAGAVVAAVSGVTYWDYVRGRIFDRAGMVRSDYNTTQQWQSDKDFAHMYGERQANGRRTDLTMERRGIGIGGGAGGVFCTAPDLLRFAETLTGDRLVAPSFVELMSSPKSPMKGDGGGPPATADGPVVHGFTAYGCTASIVNGQRKFGHGGGATGISAYISIYPDLRWVAIILANYKIPMQTLIDLQDQLITQR